MSLDEVAEVMRHQSRQIIELKIEIEQNAIEHKKEVKSLREKYAASEMALILPCIALAIKNFCPLDKCKHEEKPAINECANCMAKHYEAVTIRNLEPTTKAWSKSVKKS